MKKTILMCMVILLSLGVHAQKKQKPTERATITKSYTAQTPSAADLESLQNKGSQSSGTSVITNVPSEQTRMMDIMECGDNTGVVEPSTLVSTATVTPSGNIGTAYSFTSVEIDISHTFDGDISLTLTSPTGTPLDLSSRNGGTGDNYTNTVFMDGAPVITMGSPPYTGTFQPEGGTLNGTFNGEDVNGNWTLTIVDFFPGCCGDITLNNFCLNFMAAVDPNAPIMNCPGDITLNASPGQCSAPYGFATPTALDPNGGSVTVTQTMGPASPGPFPVGDTVVEFTATNDEAPNEVTTCQFTVTVIDNQPPTMTCPDDITQTNDLGICGAVVIFDDPMIMDNCPPGGGTMGEVLMPTQNSTFTGSARGYVFTSPVDMVITGLEVPDTASPAAQAIQVMRFAAIPPPFSATAPYDELLFYQNNIVGTGYLPVSINVTAGDIIGILGVRGANVNSYTTQPDITIDGNTVTIERLLTQNPIDMAQAPQGTYSTEPASANKSRVNFTYLANGGPGGGMLDQTEGLPSGSVFPVGTTTNTFVYTDPGGNTATCSFDVTVTDDEAPEVVCVGGAMPASGATSASPGLAIPDGDPTGITTTMDVTDDFDITDLNVDIDISHTWVGDLTVSLTAPDGVTTAVLIDRPGVPASTFGCDGTDIQATLDDEAATPVEDECGGGVPTIAGSFIPNEALSVFDGMSTVGTWTLFLSDSATPDPGVLNSWSLNYDYLATTSPPLEVFLDEDGMALVPASMFVSMATDNCSIATIEVVDGVNLPTIDQCGDNVGGAISSTLPPTESVTTVAEAGVIGADYTLDNVEIDITHTFDGDLEIELISPAGTPLMLSDNNGGSGNDFIDTVFMDGGADINTGSAPFTGTFEPEGGTFAATFDGEAITGDWTLRVTDTFGGDDGTLDSFCISFVPINPSQALFTCDDVGNTTVDIIVTDIGGNTAMCTASVLVIDNIDPILVCQDFTLELGPDGTAMLDPMDLIDMTNTIEACGISVDAVSEDDFDCDDIGTPQMITLFVSDPSGNLASCVATVTVVDLLGPEVTCPADMTIDPGANNQLYEVPDYFADGLASATDNCTDPVTVFAQDPAAGSFLGDGVYTVTLSAFDEYGNEGTCTFELTIESILGAVDNTLDAGVTLYPNPAQNQVILSNASNILLTKATMYDVNGKLVSTIDLSNMTTEKTIDISQLASGVYIVQIEGDNASVVKRLIKE